MGRSVASHVAIVCPQTTHFTALSSSLILLRSLLPCETTGDEGGFRVRVHPYAPDDTVTAISIFNGYAGAEESNRRVLAWIEQSLTPLLAGPATAMAGPVIVHTLA